MGVFTPTEAGAIAVVYSLLLVVVVYKEVNFGQLPSILINAGKTTAIVMLLIGASSGMSWIVSYENIPRAITDFLLMLSENPLLILLIINLTLLAVGAFMDIIPTVLIPPLSFCQWPLS